MWGETVVIIMFQEVGTIILLLLSNTRFGSDGTLTTFVKELEWTSNGY